MSFFTSTLHNFLDGIGPFFLLLGLLIFVHELGHFLVAKFFGVRVEVFSLGFGKKLFTFKRGDTNYCISIVPLGGYVKMYGDDPSANIPEEQKKYSFLHKPVAQRIAVVLAGPLMNLFFAIFLFLLISVVGEQLPSNIVGDVNDGTRAYAAGFRSGDQILEIDGRKVDNWLEVKGAIEAGANKLLHFVVQREGSSEHADVQVTPVLGANENILSHRQQVGTVEGLDSSSVGAMVGVTGPDTFAAKSGLAPLDLIISVNGQDVANWREMERALLQELGRGRSPINLKAQSYAEEKAPVRDIQLKFDPAPEGAPALNLAALGLEQAQLYLWKVKHGSPADRAGLKAQDRVVSVNGTPITNWSQVIDVVKDFNPDGKPIPFVFNRDGKALNVEIIPELTPLMTPQGKEEKRFTVGIISGFSQVGPKPVLHRAKSVGEVLEAGVQRTLESTTMVVMSIVRLVQGDVSARNVGGIISIGRFANQSYEAGFSAFLKMMALISINLFLLNLLPVPVLDGGHLVFYSIEALRGAPLSMRKMEIAQQVGLVLLMSLMAFALFNDISNWLTSVW